MKFNASQLDNDFYLDRAKAEANEIFSNESTRRGRSFRNILETTLYGHAAEVFLIQERAFKDDPRKYKDVIDTNGFSVEIKVTEGDYYVPYVLERAEKAKLQVWREYPDILYVFIGNKKTADYELNGVYKWNSKRFVLQSNEISV
jgi:hypothetical protein